jgi:hypothetical protein
MDYKERLIVQQQIAALEGVLKRGDWHWGPEDEAFVARLWDELYSLVPSSLTNPSVYIREHGVDEGGVEVGTCLLRRNCDFVSVVYLIKNRYGCGLMACVGWESHDKLREHNASA